MDELWDEEQSGSLSGYDALSSGDQADIVDFTATSLSSSRHQNGSSISEAVHALLTSEVNESSPDYFYDYNESVSHIPVEEITSVALVYGLTLALGVLGNSLVIFTIIRVRRMQSITNIFLTSLASADLLLLFICVPIKVSGRNLGICVSCCVTIYP